MEDQDKFNEVMESIARRREERRHFLRSASAAAVVAGGASILSACSDSSNNNPPPPTGGTPPPPPPPPAATTPDQDILNFALNLEYLEAQFYSFAATGFSISGDLLTGTGRAGAPTGGRQVTFTDPQVRQFANEIAADERAHVAFLRNALGSAAVAQPDLDISASGAFSAAARAAGLITAGQTFDPYANDENFLLGAFIFEDVGVSAYKGAAPLLTSKTFLDASAGILAAEAYHAGLIRTVLYQKGLQTPSLRTSTTKISDARDSLDGPTDVDQGIEPIGSMSNVVPTDANGIAYSRSAGDVLNIVYLTGTAATAGGFFPNGVNGNIRASTAA